MPGNVPTATVVDNFPAGIRFRAFSESREWLVLQNTYNRGEVQAKALVSISRKGPWRMTFRGTAANLATLRNFYDDHGMTVPFYFSPLNEAERAARFNCPWQQTSYMGVCEIVLEILEIA